LLFGKLALQSVLFLHLSTSCHSFRVVPYTSPSGLGTQEKLVCESSRYRLEIHWFFLGGGREVSWMIHLIFERGVPSKEDLDNVRWSHTTGKTLSSIASLPDIVFSVHSWPELWVLRNQVDVQVNADLLLDWALGEWPPMLSCGYKCTTDLVTVWPAGDCQSRPP
jgi:hypothetical protein